MESFHLSFLTLFMALSISCCSSQQLPQPVRPEKVRGWGDVQGNGFTSIGMFVLNKGESTDNGELGIKIIDIISPQPCAEGGSYAGMPKVILGFYRPSDRRLLCEATFTPGGTLLGNGPPYCSSEVGLSAISVNAINTEEGWVWFDLRK